MAHKELTSKSDFDAALAVKDRFVFIYFYEGELPDSAAEKAQKFAATTDAYSVNVGANELPKQHFKIEKVPTAIVYKNGEEVKRVDDMNAENMKGIADLLAE